MVRISRLDCRPKAVNGGVSSTKFWFDPVQQLCGIGQVSTAAGMGTPSDEWLGKTLTHLIGEGILFPLEHKTEEFLYKRGQKLLAAVSDGFSIVPNKYSNLIGTLTPEAQTTWAAFCGELDRLTARAGYCEAADWGCDELTGTETDATLDDLADEIEDELWEDQRLAIGNMRSYLRRQRDAAAAR